MMDKCQTFLIFLYFYYVTKALDVRLVPKCKPVNTDFCSELYNETHIDRPQDDAILDLKQYKALVAINCAEPLNLRLFLCGTFLPMCTVLEKPLRPCRSLCEEVKAGCEKVLRKYVDLPWPYQLRCSQFPVKTSKNLCIGKDQNKKKEVVFNRVPPNKRTKVNEGEIIILQCNSLEKINFKKIIHGSNCERPKSTDALRKLCNSEQSCEFDLNFITKSAGQPSTCYSGNIGQSSIKYQCKLDTQTKQMVLKYGADANLYCKSPTRHIVILKVQFKDETCISPNAFCSVSQACTGKHKCALWADQRYLQSPCQGKNINLIVDYECQKNNFKQEQEVTGLLEDGIVLKCPSKDSIIAIVRAEYKSEFCRTKQIHCAVNLRCDKKNACKLTEINLSAVKCTEARSEVRIRYICS